MSAENISYDLKRFAGIKRDYSPEEVEVMKNLSEQIDPQFAGNDIIENNGIKYIEIGGDFYPI